MTAGMDSYISKPLQPGLLFEAIERVIVASKKTAPEKLLAKVKGRFTATRLPRSKESGSSGCLGAAMNSSQRFLPLFIVTSFETGFS